MKQMGVREFLRGGYRKIAEPTLVSSHSRVLFTVLPHGLAGERRFLETMLKVTEPKRTTERQATQNP